MGIGCLGTWVPGISDRDLRGAWSAWHEWVGVSGAISRQMVWEEVVEVLESVDGCTVGK